MAGYRVVDTRETQQMTEAGRVVKAFQVWLITDKGATGTLEVPASDWEAEKLGALLAAKAEELDLAFALTE